MELLGLASIRAREGVVDRNLMHAMQPVELQIAALIALQ